MKTSCASRPDIWDFPVDVVEQLTFIVRGDEACIMELYDNSDEYLLPETFEFARQKGELRGNKWRSLCDWWSVSDSNVYKGAGIIRQLDRGLIQFCPKCYSRVVEHIMRSSIEFMIGLGHWMPNTERGLFRIGDSVTDEFAQEWENGEGLTT